MGPTGMTASAINSRKILLSWTDNENTYAEDGFEVRGAGLEWQVGAYCNSGTERDHLYRHTGDRVTEIIYLQGEGLQGRL